MIHEVRQSNPGVIVADMGCGEAKLAETIDKDEQKNAVLSSSSSSSSAIQRKRVYSFDLANPSQNRYITPCDIAHVPLPIHSVDIVIFCLSLMGTNYWDFIREADRILRYGGKLLIAEVRSRFESGGNNDEDDNTHDPYTTNNNHKDGSKKRKRDDYTVVTNVKQGIDTFVKAIENLGTHGYSLTRRDEKNTMFVLLFFRKKGDPTLNVSTPTQSKSSTSSTHLSSSSKGKQTIEDNEQVSASSNAPPVNDEVPLSSSAKRRKRKQKQKLTKLLAQQPQQTSSNGNNNTSTIITKRTTEEDDDDDDNDKRSDNDDGNDEGSETNSSNHVIAAQSIEISSSKLSHVTNSSTAKVSSSSNKTNTNRSNSTHNSASYGKFTTNVLPPVLKACVYKKR